MARLPQLGPVRRRRVILGVMAILAGIAVAVVLDLASAVIVFGVGTLVWIVAENYRQAAAEAKGTNRDSATRR